ncbi:hypothetical protein BGZ67_004759 [Mortierella alpina]|nr:hypothetical protein BGZ67_004759 [Mortierella alpina]
MSTALGLFGVKDLILADEGEVVSPDGSQDGSKQENDGHVVERRQFRWAGEEEALNLVGCPDVILDVLGQRGEVEAHLRATSRPGLDSV